VVGHDDFQWDDVEIWDVWHMSLIFEPMEY
jgi:hypothetical protein